MPSRHAFGAAYITVDHHRAVDNNTYVFKTEDYEKTWQSIGAGIPKSAFAYARVVQEDLRRKGMLYLGTANGLYVTVDDGAAWMPLQNNLPHTPIAWLAERVHLFDPRPAYAFALREPTTSESFAAEFDPPSISGHNPPYGASICLFLGRSGTQSKWDFHGRQRRMSGTVPQTDSAQLLPSSAGARTGKAYYS